MKNLPFRIMSFYGDITSLGGGVDVIVNAAKPSLVGGSGVDGAIHKAAGPELLKACISIPGAPVRCKPGEVVVTEGFKLNSRIYHTVGSELNKENVYTKTDVKTLQNCYKLCLKLCVKEHYKTIAFPIIGSGSYNWDKDIAIRIAVSEIHNFLLFNDNIEKVIIVAYSEYEEKLITGLLEKYKILSAKKLRSVALYASESRRAYLRDVRENRSPGFSLVYCIRLLLVLAPYFYPISHVVRDISGRISWNARRSAIEIEVLTKLIILILILWGPINTNNTYILEYLNPFIVIYFMTETIYYNSSLLFLKDIQNSSASSIRSLLFLFINICELQIGFAYLYRHYDALHNVSTNLEYLHFAFTNNGDVLGNNGMIIEIIQSGLSIFMIGILLAIFLSGVEPRDYIDR